MAVVASINPWLEADGGCWVGGQRDHIPADVERAEDDMIPGFDGEYRREIARKTPVERAFYRFDHVRRQLTACLPLNTIRRFDTS